MPRADDLVDRESFWRDTRSDIEQALQSLEDPRERRLAQRQAMFAALESEVPGATAAGLQTKERSKNMKSLIAILSLFTVALTLPLQDAQETEKSLYERLGGVFAIAAVVDHFSDAVVQNPIVGKTSKNPVLREWHTKNLDRLPGLRFMRTLWVCEVTGGPFKFSPTEPGKTHLGLEEAHRDLKISPEEFDEVAAELGRSLDFAKVPAREKGEVLAAFAAHKKEVTAGYTTK